MTSRSASSTAQSTLGISNRRNLNKNVSCANCCVTNHAFNLSTLLGGGSAAWPGTTQQVGLPCDWGVWEWAQGSLLVVVLLGGGGHTHSTLLSGGQHNLLRGRQHRHRSRMHTKLAPEVWPPLLEWQSGGGPYCSARWSSASCLGLKRRSQDSRTISV
jgi:hypothetical protein